MVFLWFVALLPPVPMSPLLPGAVVPASFAFNVICGGFKGVLGLVLAGLPLLLVYS